MSRHGAGKDPEVEALRTFHARTREYLRLGYDRIAAARFVAGMVADLRGPALDVGTGKGLLAVGLARRGMTVVSVDVDDEERRLARLLADEARVTTNITFVHGDAARLACPSGHFGCADMQNVVHHLVRLTRA